MRVHPTGSVTVFTGTPQPRPGARDDLRAARGREARRADRQRRGRPRRHRPHPVRHGHLRLALGRRSAARRSYKAIDKIIDKGKKIAAHLLEAKRRATSSSRTASSASPAPTARRPSARSPSPPTCRTTTRSRRSSRASRRRRSTIPRTSPSRAAATPVEVEIDPETGVVEVVDVAIADDVGVIINPMIVDGQAHGGLAQGIGQALLEECRLRRRRAAPHRLVHELRPCRARPTCRCSRSATTSPRAPTIRSASRAWARSARSASRPR